MTEFENFQKLNEHKSNSTQLNYTRQYNKLHKLAGGDIADISQKKILEIIYSNASNPNQISSLTNIAFLIRRMNKMPLEELVSSREKNKTAIEKHVKKVNMETKLPDLEELKDYTEYLYDQGKWTKFVLNYLMLNLQVRNKDLNFKIVTRKKDMVDNRSNYIRLNYRHKKAVYVRNDYKTNNTYGKKTHVLTNKKLLSALYKILSCQKHDEDCGVIIKNPEHLGYYVQQATFNKIGEGAYLKVIINDAREKGNIQMLAEISENRGTSVNELLKSYDSSRQ
jgi:hypothetical protein